MMMSLFSTRAAPPKKSDAMEIVMEDQFETRSVAAASETSQKAKIGSVPPVSFREVDCRQKALVNQVMERCTAVKNRFSQELSNAAGQGRSAELRSGIGVIFSKGCVIDIFLPSVAASRLLRKGDTVTAVDGKKVSDDTIAQMLSSGPPGSQVCLMYRPEGSETLKEVKIERLPVSTLDNRKSMLDMFEQLKASALKSKNDEHADLVDKMVEKWQKTLWDDEEMRSNHSNNMSNLIEAGEEAMQDFADTVEKLKSMYDLERFILEQESLQLKVPTLEEAMRRLLPEKDAFLSQIAEKDAEIARLQSNMVSLTEAMKKSEISADGEAEKSMRELVAAQVVHHTLVGMINTICSSQ